MSRGYLNEYPPRQRGSALIAALFLIVVLAALGAVAVKIGADQQHTASLQLMQARALSAANAGLEYWAYRAFNNPNVACPAAPVVLSNIPRMDEFTVRVSCPIPRIASGGEGIYEVTAVATRGVYGTPDFVSRQLSRRMTNIGPGTW